MDAYHEVGDALVGDRIVGEARKISKPKVMIKSGRHKSQQFILIENARCRIEKKLRFIKM